MANQKFILEKYDQYNHFGKLLGMEYTEMGIGKITYRLTISEKHLATPNAAHGGVIAALMDGMLGVAALSAVAHDSKVVSTIEYKTSFFSPALLGDVLEGKAWVEKTGKRILFSAGEITVVNRDFTIIAKGMGTFNAYPAEKAGY
ncbi:MAG: PaaI family thioesterase [Bacteroidota bacterium]|nr:PaaI family thioesterase [Bacteroidota bacterium]